MSWAETAAQRSYCKRAKVGCVITTEDLKDVLSYGFNGTISGFPNNCENTDGTTNQKLVIHAEQNALDKLTASNKSSVNAVLFVTLSPCAACATRIINVGIKTVYYKEQYHNTEGLELLEEAGIEVVRLPFLEENPEVCAQRSLWVEGLGE